MKQKEIEKEIEKKWPTQKTQYFFAKISGIAMVFGLVGSIDAKGMNVA